MSQRRLGITYALIAYGIWGVLPLYLKALRAVAPLEVVAHRIVWSAALLVVLVTVGRQRTFVAQLRARPSIIATFMASALALSINLVAALEFVPAEDAMRSNWDLTWFHSGASSLGSPAASASCGEVGRALKMAVRPRDSSGNLA